MYSSVARMVHTISQGSVARDISVPLKTRRQDCEYAPYHAPGKTVVEIHDGIHFLPDIAIEDFFKERVIIHSEESYPSLSLENIFILLLVTAYQNSESVASNLFDFGSVLRDYVDLKAYFDKYHSDFIWPLIRKKIRKYNLCDVTGIILQNLNEVYGRDVTYGCLSGIPLKQSKWKMSVLNRLQDTEKTKANTLKILRQQWKSECLNNEYVIRFTKEKKTAESQWIKINDTVRCILCYDVEGIIIQWQLSDSAFQKKDDYLYQLRLYPLSENVLYTQYKVDVGFYNHSEFRSYGRRTDRLREEAVQKQSGDRYYLADFRQGNHHMLTVHVPFEDLGITENDLNRNIVISAHSYQKYAEDIYQNTNGCGEIKYLLKTDRSATDILDRGA